MRRVGKFGLVPSYSWNSSRDGGLQEGDITVHRYHLIAAHACACTQDPSSEDDGDDQDENFPAGTADHTRPVKPNVEPSAQRKLRVSRRIAQEARDDALKHWI